MKSISFWSMGRLLNLSGSWKSSIMGRTTTLGPVAPAGLDCPACCCNWGAAWAATNQQNYHESDDFFYGVWVNFYGDGLLDYLWRGRLCETLSLARAPALPENYEYYYHFLSEICGLIECMFDLFTFQPLLAMTLAVYFTG